MINRMGFNNGGLDAYLARLAALPRGAVPVGANVGINKDGADPERDYPALIAAVAPLADYVVINVSSPNTPGLRDLQGEARLRADPRAVAAARAATAAAAGEDRPGSVATTALAALVETCVRAGRRRADRLQHHHRAARQPALAARAGGRRVVGGAAVRAARPPCWRARLLLARGRLVLIGVRRRVVTGEDALTKIQAGASLVQLYTAFAYDGPALIPRLKAELPPRCATPASPASQDAVGTGRPRTGRTDLMEHLTGFAPLAERFDGFILDLWGVIHDGVNALSGRGRLPGAAARRRQARGAAVERAASRAPAQAAMRAHGHRRRALHRHHDQRRGGASALRDRPDPWWATLGPACSISGRSATATSWRGWRWSGWRARPRRSSCSTPARTIIATRPTWPSSSRCWAIARAARLKMVCANPDLEVIRGGKRVMCAGALAIRYARTGRRRALARQARPGDLRAGAEMLDLPTEPRAGGGRRAADRHRGRGGDRVRPAGCWAASMARHWTPSPRRPATRHRGRPRAGRLHPGICLVDARGGATDAAQSLFP